MGPSRGCSHTTFHVHTPDPGGPRVMEGKLRPKRKRDWLTVTQLRDDELGFRPDCQTGPAPPAPLFSLFHFRPPAQSQPIIWVWWGPASSRDSPLSSAALGDPAPPPTTCSSLSSANLDTPCPACMMLTLDVLGGAHCCVTWDNPPSGLRGYLFASTYVESYT